MDFNGLIMQYLQAWAAEEPILKAYILAATQAAGSQVTRDENDRLRKRIEELEAGQEVTPDGADDSAGEERVS